MIKIERAIQLKVLNVSILSPRRKYVRKGKTKYDIPKLTKRADQTEPPIAAVVKFQAYQKDSPHGRPKIIVAAKGLSCHHSHMY